MVAFHDIKLWCGGTHEVGKISKEEVLGRLFEELLATCRHRGKLLELTEHLT